LTTHLLQAEFELLLMMVERYEAQHFMVKPPDPVTAIESAIEQRGLLSADLRGDLIRFDWQMPQSVPVRLLPPLGEGSDGGFASQFQADDCSQALTPPSQPSPKGGKE
jgi:hypothetical protein